MSVSRKRKRTEDLGEKEIAAATDQSLGFLSCPLPSSSPMTVHSLRFPVEASAVPTPLSPAEQASNYCTKSNIAIAWIL